MSSHPNSVTYLGEVYRSTFIYPALQHSPAGLDFSYQFAFRPSGSTTAVLVALFHTARTLLSDNQLVHVSSFDFSKAIQHCPALHTDG